MIDLAKYVVAESRSIDSFAARGFEAEIYTAVRTRRGVGGAVKDPLWFSLQGGVRVLCKWYRVVFYEILEAVYLLRQGVSVIFDEDKLVVVVLRQKEGGPARTGGRAELRLRHSGARKRSARIVDISSKTNTPRFGAGCQQTFPTTVEDLIIWGYAAGAGLDSWAAPGYGEA